MSHLAAFGLGAAFVIAVEAGVIGIWYLITKSGEGLGD
jgi:hypothetical protein